MEENLTIYVETTVISYCTAWESNNPIRSAHQKITKEWWNNHSHNYQLYVSEIVLGEVSSGDQEAAQERLDLIKGIPILNLFGNDIENLANKLTQQNALPNKAYLDALHIAIASVYEINYLLTWNCKHIANVATLPKIKETVEEQGYNCPWIVTPEQF